MACNFQGSTCEGAGQACEGASHAVYEVKVTQEQHLCGPCAAEKSHLIVTEKIGQPKWVCGKHDEVVKLFCETHDQEACSSCAMVNHQKPCDLRDLQDVIAYRRSEAAEVLVLAAETKEEVTKAQEELDLKKTELQKFNESNADKIKAKWDQERRQCHAKEEDLAIKINKKADEAIKKINDERNAQLRKLKEAADDKRDSIEKRQDNVLAEFAVHTKSVHDELQSYGLGLQQIARSLTKNMAKLKLLLKKDDRETLKRIKQAVLATKESTEVKPTHTSRSLNARCLWHEKSILGLTNCNKLSSLGRIPWCDQFDQQSYVPASEGAACDTAAAWDFVDDNNDVRKLNKFVDEQRADNGSIALQNIDTPVQQKEWASHFKKALLHLFDLN